MNTELETRIDNFINDVDRVRELYIVLMDCIKYHVFYGNNCNNVFPLAEIIEGKFKNLEASADLITFNIYNK